MDVRWVHPEPGFVAKTVFSGGATVPSPYTASPGEGVPRKAFLNVCVSKEIEPATARAAAQDGKAGEAWRLPYSLAPPREDKDHGTCVMCVYAHQVITIHGVLMDVARSGTVLHRV